MQSEYLVNRCGTSVGAVTLLAERFSHRIVAWQDARVSSKIMAARCVGRGVVCGSLLPSRPRSSMLPRMRAARRPSRRRRCWQPQSRRPHPITKALDRCVRAPGFSRPEDPTPPGAHALQGNARRDPRCRGRGRAVPGCSRVGAGPSQRRTGSGVAATRGHNRCMRRVARSGGSTVAGTDATKPRAGPAFLISTSPGAIRAHPPAQCPC